MGFSVVLTILIRDASRRQLYNKAAVSVSRLTNDDNRTVWDVLCVQDAGG